VAVIHYYVHGRGRGHATRSRAIVSGLERASHCVRTFAGEGAADVDLPHEAVRSLPRTFDWRTPHALASRVHLALREARQDRPRVLVSDGDLPSLLAARVVSIPTIAVGHGLVFSHCVRPRTISARPWRRESWKARLSSLGATHAVAVSFVPLVPRSSATTVARAPVTAVTRGEREDRVVCYFRDANGAAVVRALVEAGERPIVFGSIDATIPGAHHRDVDRSAFMSCLARARAVVASAGSQLISECASARVPLFALFAQSDDEQRLNVEMLRFAGVGDGMAFEMFAPARLSEFLGSLATLPISPVWHAPDAVEAVVRLCDELAAHD
jgi:hypothetical protein